MAEKINKTLIFNLLLAFIAFVFLAKTVNATTRDDVIANAGNYVVTTPWVSISSFTGFGQCGGSACCPGGIYSPGSEFTLGYISTFAPGLEYFNVPYVFGGIDSKDAVITKINAGIVPGGGKTIQVIGNKKFDFGVTSDHFDHGDNTSAFLVGSDCGAFISLFCWSLPRTYTTSEMPLITLPVQPSDLKKGDVLDSPGDHARLFVGWINGVGNTAAVYEQANPPGFATTNNYDMQTMIGDGFLPRTPFPLVTSFDPADNSVISSSVPTVSISLKSATNFDIGSIHLYVDANLVPAIVTA